MKKKKVKICCETCVWNEDGLCDKLGWFVDPDDKCDDKWEYVLSDTDKETMHHEYDK